MAHVVANNEARGKYWMVTCNASDEDPEGLMLQRTIDDIEDLFDNGEFDYAVGQFERGGEANRLHIQAYFIFKERKYARWISARVYRSFLVLSRADLSKDGIKYCKNPRKEGFVRKAFEFGEAPSATRGKRTDLEVIDKGIASGEIRCYDDVNDTRVSVAARNKDWAMYRLSRAARQAYYEEERFDDVYVPQVFQYWLDKILTQTKPTERSCLFVVNKRGKMGKTRFIHEFVRRTGKRCLSLRAMPKRDMAAALEHNVDVIFIDVARGRLAFMDTVYVFMEELKDGKCAIEKYGSHTFYHPRVHVVVFMNEDVNIGQGGGVYPDTHGGGPTVEVPPSKPPLTYDRYLIWDDEYLPALTDDWSPDHEYGTDCPPFIAFNPSFEPIEARFTAEDFSYAAPTVPTSGPAFNGDEAGDGPLHTDAADILFGPANGLQDWVTVAVHVEYEPVPQLSLSRMVPQIRPRFAQLVSMSHVWVEKANNDGTFRDMFEAVSPKWLAMLEYAQEGWIVNAPGFDNGRNWLTRTTMGILSPLRFPRWISFKALLDDLLGVSWEIGPTGPVWEYKPVGPDDPPPIEWYRIQLKDLPKFGFTPADVLRLLTYVDLAEVALSVEVTIEYPEGQLDVLNGESYFINEFD